MADVDAHVEATQPAQTPAEPPADQNLSPASSEATEAVRDTDARERSEEANRYRLRLREAEERLAERDGIIGGLRGEVDRLHRLEAERLAGDLATPADLWLAASVDDMRDDTGRLDSEKVKAKVGEVLADHPGWRKRGPSFDGGARRTPDMARTPGLSDLLKPGGR
jgi:hypothetical protein